jgi:(p)ppGpp synthase/HD superfamily hydrolase
MEPFDTYFRPHSDGLEFLEDVRRELFREDLFYLEVDYHVRGIPKGSQLVDQH